MNRRRKAGGTRLLTIMFTDIEGSTALTQRLGDARAQEVLRVHNSFARMEIERFGGTEIKHTGDGIMATFESAASAVAAATAMQRESELHNAAHPESSFCINVGLNAGEPVAEDADVFGSAVQLAARACAAAAGGQVLATNVVRELVYGKGVLFQDQGLAELKGFDEPVRLFDVSGVEADVVASAGHEGGRRRLQVLGGIAALVLVVGIVAGVLSSGGSDGGEADASAPANSAGPLGGAQRTRFKMTGTTQLVSVTGDCAATDTRVAGRIDQQVRGDLVGVARTEYAATIEVARDCDGMHLQAEAQYDLNDGSFSSPNRGFSLETLGDNVALSRFSSTRALGFIEQGTGAYKGVTGFNICQSDSLRNGGELTNTSDCEAWLHHPADRRPTFVVAAMADTDELSTRIGADGSTNRFRSMVAFQNTSDRAMDGVVLSLAVPDGAEVRAVPADSAATVAGDLSWKVGSLDPGEAKWVELLVEVNRVAARELVLTPRVTVDGDTTTGWPATVRVAD